jgi:hypothetical protein
MLNTFIAINLAGMRCIQAARGLSSGICLRKRFNMITTTTNAAT